jgi:zinc protease
VTSQPQDLAFPDEDFRAHQPIAGEPRPFRFPSVQTFALARGVDVYLVEHHALPIVSMQLEVDGGVAAEPAGQRGLAAAAMAMLAEGTQRLDRLAYAEALADVASTITASAGDDTASVSLASLTKHLDATFALLAETILAPGLRASDFERAMRRRIESTRQARGSPQAIAGRVAAPIVYGADHPLGGVVTEASLRAIALDDCRDYLATWLRPARARLFVVGDVDEARVRALFDGTALAGWSGAAPPPPAIPPPRTRAGKIFFVDTPGATQAEVAYLQLGPCRDAPDHAATAIAGAVFGGSFASRINMNLREAKGYSYGARGGFAYARHHGTFAVSTRVRAEAACASLLEIDGELHRLRSPSGAPTQDEVARERSGALLALPGRFATALAALGQYRSLVYHALPLDYFDTYSDDLARVDVAGVAAAAVAHLTPSRGVYLVVGDRATPQKDDARLGDALVALAARGDVGPGALVELDADGNPIAHPSESGP